MAEPTASQTHAGYTGPRFFGAPVGDFSVPQTVLIVIASGFVAFFVATFLAIMSLLLLTAIGHKVDFAISYKWVGLPIGICTLIAAAVFLGAALVSRMRRQARR